MRPSKEIDAEEFIAVKGFKAKGKRISNYVIDKLVELEPTRFPEPKEEEPVSIDAEDEEESEVENSHNPKIVQGDLFNFIDEEDKLPGNEKSES